MTFTVSSLCVYPVKSTAGHPLHRANVMPEGLEHDRRWMLVDPEGKFLTVAGASAFAEDHWRRIRVAAVEFDVPTPCDRCVMTTVDPATGDKHPALEPLRTLSGYRRDRERGILFGVNLIARGNGTIAVGDTVEALA
jgi:uncharacterized protein YcbX